ncbi:hypothetical protein [Streptomyces sp. NPDC088725]|uniref:hypothetical protein n=1 Tax=Streptomyces sp. NPDC088725 TaxID=3365873 RepID=UPI00382E0AF1
MSGVQSHALHVLALPDTYGVVLPAASHLGRKAIEAEREKRIETAGARLLLVRGTRRARSRHGHSSPAGGPVRRETPGHAPAPNAET